MKAPQSPSPKQADQPRQTEPQRSGMAATEFVDNRPQAALQRKYQSIADNSPVTQTQRRQMAKAIPRGPAPLQARAAAGTAVAQIGEDASAQAPEATGAPGARLPGDLKAGIESLSGIDMGDVNVHYNSPEPAQLQAHAYAQGNDIHLAPSQERHLPHEAWHMVQQKQGRVQATVQMKTGVAVNDDASLEHEADVMGAKALETSSRVGRDGVADAAAADPGSAAVQKKAAAGAPLQLASTYTGPAITPAAGGWTTVNSPMNETFTYGAVTAQNTASSAHAEQIDGDYTGNPVASVPADWLKFTQLVGPYAINNLVQGHLINQNMGGDGTAQNLAPLGASANTRHWNSVEKPIRDWLAIDLHNVVDYKVTPDYSGAMPSLKNKLITEFQTTLAKGTADTPVNLRAWVGAYIDATIPSALGIQVAFAQTNPDNTRARKKPVIIGTVSNTLNSNYGGNNVSGFSGAYSGFQFGITDTITYGGLGANNRGVWGYAKMIDNLHFGSPVAAAPTNWDKFLRLVGPDATSGFVQGHLINQKIGGQGIANNLTPLTTSANAVHSSSVESPIKSWLSRKDTNAGNRHLIEYKVSPVYGGADAALKAHLLKGFDDTNAEVTGDTPVNLTTWLGNYIDATFPRQFDVDVQFMQSNMAVPHHARVVKKHKPLLQGNVSNEPA